MSKTEYGYLIFSVTTTNFNIPIFQTLYQNCLYWWPSTLTPKWWSLLNYSNSQTLKLTYQGSYLRMYLVLPGVFFQRDMIWINYRDLLVMRRR